MNYREKLLELIVDDDANALRVWIQSQPLLEQPDIFRELKGLTQEAALENGDDLSDIVPGFYHIDEKINGYEEAILDEKLAEANLVMAQQDADKTMHEIEQTVAGVREYVMDCIVNNEDNAEAMRELSQKIMQSEKDHGIFDPQNWSRIL